MTSANSARDRIAFALDYPNLESARDGATLVAPYVGVLKVGLELFIQEGAAAVSMARSLGCDVFLDLKLHDIPKTVERAVGPAASLGAKYLTIHACGGAGMMEAAAKRAESEGTAMKVLGVTVLTSLGPSDLFALGIDESPSERVMRLGTLARQAGLQGLVCSTAEVKQVRQTVGPDMLLVTPGIRPLGADAGDQKRTGTPQEAIADGSDLLVVGRPIRDAADPAEAARDLQAMVLQALE
jgi:orotidine-5'-phosphate decarboxylase